MTKVKFSNGKTVNFDGTPTRQDIEFVAKKLGIVKETTSDRIGRLKTEQTAAETEANKGLFGRFMKELPKAAVQVGLGTPAKFITSAAEVPETFRRGYSVGRTYDTSTPIGKVATLGGLLNPFQSYISEAQTRGEQIVAGEKPLYTALAPFVSVPMAGLETATTAGLGLKAIEKVAPKVGEAFKTAGTNLYKIGTPATEATKKALQTYQASKPTIVERMGNLLGKTKVVAGQKPITEANTAARLLGGGKTEWQLGVQAVKNKNKLWTNVIDPALSQNKAPVSMPSFFERMKQTIIAENSDLSRRKSLLKGLSAVQNDFKKVGNVSLSKLQNYKNGWAKFVPEKAYKGEPIAGVFNEVRNMLAQEARKTIYGTLGDDIKTAYLDYSNLKSIEEFGLKSADPLRSKSVTKQAWEFILDKVLTPITNLGGKILYKTGEGLEFIGNPGAKTVNDVLFKDLGAFGSKITSSVGAGIKDVSQLKARGIGEPQTLKGSLSHEATIAKASGQSFDEWVKIQNDPLLEFKKLGTVKDGTGAGTVKEAINDIGGINNVRRGEAPIGRLETTENINTNSQRYKAIEAEVKSGKITPIITDEYLRVMDGHHRLEVYKSMGMKEVPVIVPKETVGVKFKTRSQLIDIWNKAKGK